MFLYFGINDDFTESRKYYVITFNFRSGKLNKTKKLFILYLLSYSDNLNFLAIPFNFRWGKLDKNIK